MNDLIGKEVRVSLEPYEGGTAKVVAVRPTHEYGKPDRLIPDYTTLVVEAVDMHRTSRLMGHSSTKPVPTGEVFELHLYTTTFNAQAARGEFRYVYSV